MNINIGDYAETYGCETFYADGDLLVYEQGAGLGESSKSTSPTIADSAQQRAAGGMPNHNSSTSCLEAQRAYPFRHPVVAR
jgi:hypothetical protein